MFCDLALSFDDLTQTCDLAFADDGDLSIDVTAETPLLLSIGLDRRAAEGDELPDGVTNLYRPDTYYQRRGSVLDACDRFGEFQGCRMWLLGRAKQTEETRLLAEYWLGEGTTWAKAQTGSPAEIEAWWAARGLLRWRVATGDDEITAGKRVT
ncbi:phage GP46 family protein [Rhizobium sp. C1]|uniref:phage GP46 family protein n=1 Tax=Rhizobium sp. C1 TaxID=1349799 RepID=UPI001E36FFEC|nr:phage GP46 family protein [Rhizobium sp. C1]MCD2176436.1 phage GP46 family protein [Rhizobium sp. C1]